MAQNILFTTHRSLQVKSDTTYSKDNANLESTSIRIAKGVRIEDEFGNKTPLRGLRVKIEVTGLTAPTTPLPNVATVWYEGEIQKFHANGTYTFYDDGVVEIGEYTTI